MLEHPKKSRSAFGTLLLLALAGGALFEAYRLGERHGRQGAFQIGTVQCAAASAVVVLDAGQAGSSLTPLAPLPNAVAGSASPERPAAIGDAGGAVAGATDDGSDGGSGQTFHLALTLQGSLDEAVQAAATTNDGPALTMVISRLLVWWGNPSRDARPGDKLWVVYQTPPGQEPLVVALRYQSQKLGTTKTAIRFQPPGAAFARYYEPDGTEVEERLVDSPLEDWEQITSLLRDGRGHKGVDFKVPVGTDVHSPVEGTVTKRNWKVRANGDCLAVEDHKTHRELIFLHLSAIEPGIQIGSQVKPGQVIAKTGNTGHTTAPHLHYQVMSADNRVLDPFAVQATTRRKLPPAELSGLQKALVDYSPELGPTQRASR